MTCSSTGFRSTETENLKQMQLDAVSATAGGTLFGFGISGDVNFDNVKGSYKGKCTEATLANSHLEVCINGGPPEVTDLPSWKEGLAANNHTWILTDRGDKLIAVWDVIIWHHKWELGTVADVLRKAWEEMTGLKAEQCLPVILSCDSNEILKEITKWNEEELTSQQIIDNLEFLLTVKKEILAQTSNHTIWIDDYLSQPVMQTFILLVIRAPQESTDLDHVKFLCQQLVERNELEQLSTRSFPNIKQVLKWLYNSSKQPKSSCLLSDCIDFDSFDKYLEKTIHDVEMDELNDDEQLPCGPTSRNQHLASNVSAALHNLRSHYQQTYDDILITVLVHRFPIDIHDNVITLKPIALSELTKLRCLFQEHVLKFHEYKHANKESPLHFQAFLFNLALDVCQERSLMQRMKNMMTNLNPPLEQQLNNKVNRYLRFSSKRLFKTALQSFMYSDNLDHVSGSQKKHSHSLKEVLMTVPYEYKASICDQSKIFENNRAAHTLFKTLGLCQHYLEKMSLRHAQCIRPESLKLSLNESPLTDLKQLPNLILHKIMSYDYLCRSDLIPHREISNDSSDNETSDNSSDETSDDSSDEETSKKKVTKRFKETSTSKCDHTVKLHPVDCLLAVILSSDNFLRQDLFSRLAKCQLAIPFILPDPFTKQLLLPLWSMRSIVKEWKCIKTTESSSVLVEHSHPIISYGMPIVSFIRFGTRQRRGASKSKMLNEVISDSHYDHYFHRDCPGGQSHYQIEGLIDMCWYLPAGKSTDMFSHPITFLNLHGDARQFADQRRYLSQISSMCFVVVTEDNIEFDMDTIEHLRNFSASPGGLTVLSNVEKTPKALKSEDFKMHRIKLPTKNADEIKIAIRRRIQKKLQDDEQFKAIESCCVSEFITKCNIVSDESCNVYKQGFDEANNIISMITSFTDEKKSAKEAMLPLQGETWQAWAEKHKEFYRQIHRGNKTVNDYTAIIDEQKTKIRKKQLEYVTDLSPVMKAFITSLLKLGGTSNRTVRSYFLQCLKLALNNLSNGRISALQHSYQTARKQLSKAQTKTSNSSTQSNKERDTLTKKDFSEHDTLSVKHDSEQVSQSVHKGAMSLRTRSSSSTNRGKSHKSLKGIPKQVSSTASSTVSSRCTFKQKSGSSLKANSKSGTGERDALSTQLMTLTIDSLGEKEVSVSVPTDSNNSGSKIPSKVKVHLINQSKKQIELIQKEIIDASFGLEHLLRELGQVYEAARESSEFGEELSRLPKAVAELLIEGYPLEIMDGNVAHVPQQWVSAVLMEAVKRLSDPKVCVLSVLGLQSTGKSTMLNAAFGLQFNVSAGRCTRGAFMQLLSLDEDLKLRTGCSYVLVVDTEGLRAPELDFQLTQKHDNELATFIIGLADVTLINIYGEVPGEMDDILQTSVHAFLRMRQVKFNPSCHKLSVCSPKYWSECKE